jgi:hypothetical protein
MNRNLNTGIVGIKFKNSHTVYESFIKCTVKDYEYNLSYNPTLLSGSQGILVPYSASNGGSIVYINSGSNYGILKSFTTGSISGSDFSPYVGAIGLYNDGGDLLAIGKMAAPIPLSANTDTTFVIKYDTQWLKKPYFTPSPSPSGTPFPTPTPSPSLTPTPTPSSTPLDCTVGAATAVFMVSNTPSVTPTISVTPSVTSTPIISATPSVTPSATKPVRNVTLTFTSYSAGQFTFTLSSKLNFTLYLKNIFVEGFNTSTCNRSYVTTDSVSNVTIPVGTTTVSTYGDILFQNFTTFSPPPLRYKKSNSMYVTQNSNGQGGNIVSNGSILNLNGVSITIVIDSAACNVYQQ